MISSSDSVAPMSGVFTSTASFRNNLLIVIEALNPSESKSGTWLRNELLDLKSSISIPNVELHKISSSNECRDLLRKIAFRCLSEGILPILHFEAHGSCDSISFPDDQMRWSDMMLYLRDINHCAQGNLGVVMSTCHGFYALTPLDINNATPFFFLMGSQERLYVSQIKINMLAFYKELFFRGDLNAAMEKVEKTFKQYNSERFFFTLLGKIFRSNFVGADRDRRIASGLRIVNYEKLKRKIRRDVYWVAKEHNRATKRIFDRYANVFFPYGHSISSRRFINFIWDNYRLKHNYVKPRRLPPKITRVA